MRTACCTFGCTWLGEGLSGSRASAQWQSGAGEWGQPERQPAGKDPVRRGQIRRSLAGAIQDQELMLKQKRLGNKGMGTARSEQTSQASDEMDQKDDQIAHHRIVAGREIPTNYERNDNSPATGTLFCMEPETWNPEERMRSPAESRM